MAAPPDMKSTRNVPAAILALASGSPSLYGAPYIMEIRKSVRARHTRCELRRLYLHGTGKPVPSSVNLRNHVAKWHAHQQAINAGEAPSAFGLLANVRDEPRHE